jgi:hypothetical protein
MAPATTGADVVANALESVFFSPNETEQNGVEGANVVEGLFAIARAIDRLASVADDVTHNRLGLLVTVQVRPYKAPINGD